MTKIDIYAMIPGAGEQTWTIWTADVRKEWILRCGNPI